MRMKWGFRRKELTEKKKKKKEERFIFLFFVTSHRWSAGYSKASVPDRFPEETVLACIFEVMHFIKGFGNHWAKPKKK